MRIATLDLLRCPFCGTQPGLIDNRALIRTATDIESGVLGCQCCAFPIVAGIPVMIADAVTRQAMHALESGERETALLLLLGLHGDPARADAFRALLRQDGPPLTYTRAMAVLSPDAEGQYFVYRFSDPTFLMASAVLQALGRDPRVGAGRALDLCGGSGHLTRVVSRLAAPGETTLADVFFWKLWLARRFMVPDAAAVCCDANQPLPFARGAFALTVCSDAFPYIWQKRLLAEEMMRATAPDGIVALPHLHSSLGFNFSAGMTLTPTAYRDLFGPLEPRLFKDSVLLDQVLDGAPLDLEAASALNTLDEEPSVTLVATRQHDVFRRYAPPAAPATVAGALIVNPLYTMERTADGTRLTLAFPTSDYEMEFSATRRYLPATLTVPVDLTVPFTAAALGDAYEELRRRHVILDAPPDY